MSEGGRFPWKLQKIRRFGPTADYSGLKKPLSEPPKGKVWHYDNETREWSIRDEKENKSPDQEKITIENVPNVKEESKTAGEGEWDLLSDKLSASSVGGGGVFVTRNGSLRSITSFTTDNNNNSSSSLSAPYKVHRTFSSSTIDSTDGCSYGVNGVLGVDYVEHVILKTDTLQGLCLAYKCSATRIRQANHFSGNSLLLAPKKLLIPMTKKAQRSGKMFIQDKDSAEFKLSAFRADCPDLSATEAKAYLEMNDWDLHEAVRAAREDGEWEKEVDDQIQPTRVGNTDIRITVKCQEGGTMGVTTIGAGIQPKAAPKPPPRSEPVIYEGVPAIATKSVTPQDIYNAAPQHEGFGLEMQPLVKSASTP